MVDREIITGQEIGLLVPKGQPEEQRMIGRITINRSVHSSHVLAIFPSLPLHRPSHTFSPITQPHPSPSPHPTPSPPPK